MREHICHFLVANNDVLVQCWLLHTNDGRKKKWYNEILSMFLGFIWTSWMEGRKLFIRFKNLYFIFKYLEASSLALNACVPVYWSVLVQIAMSFLPKINILFIPFYFGRCRNSNEKAIFCCTTSEPPTWLKKKKFKRIFEIAQRTNRLFEWHTSAHMYNNNILSISLQIAYISMQFLCIKQKKKMFIKLLKYRVCHCIYSGRWWHRSYFFFLYCKICTRIWSMSFLVLNIMLPRIFKKNDIKH